MQISFIELKSIESAFLFLFNIPIITLTLTSSSHTNTITLDYYQIDIMDQIDSYIYWNIHTYERNHKTMLKNKNFSSFSFIDLNEYRRNDNDNDMQHEEEETYIHT